MQRLQKINRKIADMRRNERKRNTNKNGRKRSEVIARKVSMEQRYRFRLDIPGGPN